MRRPTHTAVCWWLDAWSRDQDDEPAGPERGYVRVWSGLLVQDDEHGVCLVKGWDPEDQTGSHKSFIPRGMVRRLLRYKINW